MGESMIREKIRGAILKIKRSLWYAPSFVSPEFSVMVNYYRKFGCFPDLKDPRTLNEKIQWIKLNTCRTDQVVRRCADKYRVREYLEQKGFGEYLPKLFLVTDDPETIDWDSLPKSFAVKLNTGWACNLIVRDKSELDIPQTVRLLKKWMRSCYWRKYAELQYKGVKHLIIVEEYLGGEDGLLPDDYKFFCADGKVYNCMVCTDRSETGGHSAKYCFMDREWQHLPYIKEYAAASPESIVKPERIGEAFELAARMSEGFFHVRTDLYILKDRIVFGEFTFTSAAGMNDLITDEGQMALGNLIELPKAEKRA